MPQAITTHSTPPASLAYLTLPTQLPGDFLRRVVIGDRFDPTWRARQLAAEAAVAADNLLIAEARIDWLRGQHRAELRLDHDHHTHRDRVSAQRRAAYWRGQMGKWLPWKRHFIALMQAPVATLAEAA